MLDQREPYSDEELASLRHKYLPLSYQFSSFLFPFCLGLRHTVEHCFHQCLRKQSKWGIRNQPSQSPYSKTSTIPEGTTSGISSKGSLQCFLIKQSIPVDKCSCMKKTFSQFPGGIGNKQCSSTNAEGFCCCCCLFFYIMSII